ncbi:hypothetical protein DSECCO2_458590 [anaerobic digester metagenome]
MHLLHDHRIVRPEQQIAAAMPERPHELCRLRPDDLDPAPAHGHEIATARRLLRGDEAVDGFGQAAQHGGDALPQAASGPGTGGRPGGRPVTA